MKIDANERTAESGLSIIERLKAKALSLPRKPGVYLFANKSGKIIYIGKAKSLKARVSSYFNEGQSRKTKRLVAAAFDFDTIIANTEFEALVLECSLIRRHRPKYNIKIKDGKGYPFIRLSSGDYPSLSVVHGGVQSDGHSRYFGPYAGWGASSSVVESLKSLLRLPTCQKQFPRDISKGRPCLQRHMNRCIGVCSGDISHLEYAELVSRAVMLLEGKTAKLIAKLELEMHERAESLQFEAAASFRDEIRSVKALTNRQNVVGGGMADTDVIAAVSGEARSGVAVLHFLDGNLVGRDVELSTDTDEQELLSAFVRQYYISRGKIPRYVLLSAPIEDEKLLVDSFAEKGYKVEFIVPKRGTKAELVRLAFQNAFEEIERVTTKEEKVRALLSDLQKILNLDSPPTRIEAVDISNTGDDGRVGVVTCHKNAKPLKSEYRHFIIKDKSIRDDYHSMEEVLKRRFARFIKGDAGFANAPDLLLVDGGSTHAAMASRILSEFGFEIPVFGMVKDDKHRTRAAVSPNGDEAAITSNPAVFAFVGRIQEETHKAALAFHQKQRSKFNSELDDIKGVGEARKVALLRHFKSVHKISAASLEELCEAVPKNTANAVYKYFREKQE